MTQLQPQSFVSNFSSQAEETDYFDYFYNEPGSEPGTLNIEPTARPSRIILIDYDEDDAIRKVDISPNALLPYLGKNSVSWMDVQGLGSEEVLREVGTIFDLHPLLLEDIVNVPQRPKLDEYKDKLMFIAHMVRRHDGVDGFVTEQVSFILGKNYLVTFQEEELEDCFDLVRERIRNNQGKVRQSKADYLAYLLLDSLIDGYFPILEHYEERIEVLEEKIISEPDRKIMQEIYSIRRELLALRRLLWPLRNVLNLMIRDDHDLLTQEVQIYFRDCYDHVIQILDILEAYRELASSLMDAYMSSVGNKMNEIMKFLTVFTAIFNPLTFIAGVYGMNFENMPELKWSWAYFACLGVMFSIASIMIFLFWKKGWFKTTYSLDEE
ncbi:magnesium and cobalt transport protein CorA [Aphanothece hegewaldii CCALA 016]|uniref:Magnesium transport protein CorA n=1 Tax=Aphanothece hegewaldii CCALA 016 TaxID=2107694 RepID=A0A2T1LUS1_9CHRO|nr:magnesium/cobalt transporter CorA [Aphanothece hegewaldii]PSF35312.1 magnesium and cobalt transport protein CorA [Aphanothece hegewaldii CCALA 016]